MCLEKDAEALRACHTIVRICTTQPGSVPEKSPTLDFIPPKIYRLREAYTHRVFKGTYQVSTLHIRRRTNFTTPISNLHRVFLNLVEGRQDPARPDSMLGNGSDEA